MTTRNRWRRPRPRATSFASTIIYVNRESRIVYASHGSEHVCGWYPDELIGNPLLFIIPERDQEAHLAAFQVVVEGGKPHEVFQSVAVSARGPDKEFPINLTLYPLAGGLMLGLLETR